MNKLTEEEKAKILDGFGEKIINNVRDNSLKLSMKIAKNQTINPIEIEKYSALSTLSLEQKEKICDLLSETVTDTIYNFLHMFEDYSDEFSIKIKHNETEYDLRDISEELGAEITFEDEDGWIPKFSKLGRFVL